MSSRSVFAFFCAAALLTAADWPQLLGPQRNGVYPGPASDVALRAPKLIWKKSVGAGFSAPIVAGGKLILFHRVDDKETVEAFDPATGNRLWIFDYPTAYRDDFGFDEGPRGTPAASEGKVWAFGAEGVLHALDLASGKKLWRVDTHPRFGVRKGFFGAAASPLIEGGSLFLNVGGPNGGGVVAFDKANGNVLWNAANDDAGYSSPIAATLDGVRSILFFTREGLIAAEPASGKIRFRFPWKSRSNASVNAALPVVSGNLIFVSASYNTGAVVLQVTGNQVKKLWESDESLSSHYATSVQLNGYLYGFHGRQEFGQEIRCIEMKTGKVLWSVPGFGAGTLTLAGTRLLIIRESGEAVTAEATPKGFNIDGKVQLLPKVVRSYTALTDGLLFVRNENILAAWRTR